MKVFPLPDIFNIQPNLAFQGAFQTLVYMNKQISKIILDYTPEIVPNMQNLNMGKVCKHYKLPFGFLKKNLPKKHITLVLAIYVTKFCQEPN